MPRTSVKSPDAFRTISEAADALDLPQHVLRFWETRFSQIKPMKRSGGRRYYRPGDIALLQGIRHLLYDEGYTIKGVQRILREQGIAHVAGLGAGQAAPQPVKEPAPAVATVPVSAPAPVQSDTAHASAARPPIVKPGAVHPALGETPSILAQPAAAQPVLHQPNVHQPSVHQPSVAPPAAQRPIVPQPVEPQPVEPQRAPEPAIRQEQPAPAHQASAYSPLGSAPASTLRFVPDVESDPQPVPADPETPLPLQPQPVSVTQPSVEPAPAAPSPAATNEPRLSPHTTETLVHALRTLLDCKAILDSARQPVPQASGSKP